MNRTSSEFLNSYNLKGKNFLSIAIEKRNAKVLNLMTRKSIDFSHLGELVINMIFSANEFEKLSTLKTLLNIMSSKKINFIQDQIIKLRNAQLSKEIIETLSKNIEEFKVILEQINSIH